MADSLNDEYLSNTLRGLGNPNANNSPPPGLLDFVQGQQNIRAGQDALANFDVNPFPQLTTTLPDGTVVPTPQQVGTFINQVPPVQGSIESLDVDGAVRTDPVSDGSELEAGGQVRDGAKDLTDSLSEFGSSVAEWIRETSGEQTQFSDRSAGITTPGKLIRNMVYPADLLDSAQSKLPFCISFEFFKRESNRLETLNGENVSNLLKTFGSGLVNLATDEQTSVQLENNSLVESNYALQSGTSTATIRSSGDAGDITFTQQVGDEAYPLSRYKDVRLTFAQESTKDRVFLYLPSSLSFTDTMSYQDTSVSGLRNIYQAAAGNSDIVSRSIVQGFAGFASSKISKSINDVVGGNFDIYNQLRAQIGQVSNPKNESLFQGMERKKFSMDFTFAPRSPEEALIAQNIVQTFRFHSVPELAPSTINYFSPHEVEIKFYRSTLLNSQTEDDVQRDSFGRALGGTEVDVNDGEQKIKLVENTEIPRLGRCFVDSVSVNYSPNSKSAFFVNGQPVQISMNLSFTQAFVMNKQFVLQGY